MDKQAGYVDYWQVRNTAESLAVNAVVDGRGTRDASTALDEIKAANVAQQGAMQAVLNAVLRARECGTSWSDIGRALGITKQGAQQRFAELDEDALARAIFETRRRGSVVHVPKPMAIVLPSFAWIREGLDENRYRDGSLRIDGGEAYVQVDVADYLEHHPAANADLASH